jgi:outer membrane protein assembly factor BamB
MSYLRSFAVIISGANTHLKCSSPGGIALPPTAHALTRGTLALALATTLSYAEPLTSGQAQRSPLPSGPLTSGAVTAEFRPDGTLLVEAIESMGTSRATARWKADADIVELAAWDSKAFELLGPTTGCDVSGRYRYSVETANVRFERVADACTPRRTLFDGTRWRPAGTAENVPTRRVVRTQAKPRPPLPRATDAFGGWPTFRGVQASGVADGQQLPDRWSGETGEAVLWKTPIPGIGHSSPIVWGDRLFVTSALSSRGVTTLEPAQFPGDGATSEDRSRQRWMLYALDRRTGRILWERTLQEGEPIDKRHIRSSYASATPATDGRVVVSWFGSHGVHAYTVNGDPLWKIDLGRVDVGAPGLETIEWGPASSPIIWNNLVILQVDTRADSFMVAFALETGEQVWKTERDELPSWSTPSVVSTTHGPELITSAANYFRGYDPRTGEERWRLRGGGGTVIQVPTPILGDGLFVLASSGIGPRRPLMFVRPGARGDLSLKEDEKSNASVVRVYPARGSAKPTPIAYRGMLYVLASNGVLDAYDLKTGEEVYRQRLPAIGAGFSTSPIAADGKLYLANEDGEMLVVSAGREFRHLATNSMGELLMATPAMSRGVMYVRGLRSLFAIGAR